MVRMETPVKDAATDWARFTDEQWHTLRRGVDYDRDPKLVRKAAQMWGSRMGYRCNVEIGTATVAVRFVPRGD